jgi:hypothetical protein
MGEKVATKYRTVCAMMCASASFLVPAMTDIDQFGVRCFVLSRWTCCRYLGVQKPSSGRLTTCNILVLSVEFEADNYALTDLGEKLIA